MLRRVTGVLVGLLLISVAVPAQVPAGPEAYNLKGLEEESNKKEFREIVPKLRNGDVAVDAGNPAHMDALNFLARYTLYRFHDSDAHDPLNTKGKTIAKLYLEFEGDLTQLTKNPAKTSAVWPLYTKAMLAHGKQALQSKPITRINVARCLARLSELKQPELLDFYTEVLLDDAQFDAVKYYMLRGMADLLAIPKEEVLKKDAVDRACRALTGLAQRSGKFLPGTPEPEKEGFRILRREAVRALAMSRLPKLSDNNKPGLVFQRLLTDAANLTPKGEMDEQIEAAIGLARINPALDPNYCPDVAASEIGAFTIAFKEFVLGDNKLRRLPCKVHAARLQEALEGLDAACTDKQPAPVKAYVTKITKLAVPLLKLLQTDNPSANQVNNLAKVLDTEAAAGGPNKELYKGGN